MLLNTVMVIALMVFGGIAGGTVNYLNGEERAWRVWCKQILLSTAAAMLVPLFLALAQSSLLESMLQSKNMFASSDIFVFFGFCLVGGIASNRFIATISKKVLQEIKQTQEEVKEIREQTAPFLEQITEPEESEEESFRNLVQVRNEERKVLKALNHPRYKLRSISGIVADTGLPREQVEKMLDELKDKGLVIEVTKTRRKGIRWMISSRGLYVLASEEP